MKKMLRNIYTDVVHKGYYVNVILPRLKESEERRTGVNAKYKNYYDVRETNDFEAFDTVYEYRNDPVVIVNVYAYYEED